MTQCLISHSDSASIERPVCAKCGTPMWLARIRPLGAQGEQRTFECPVCDISETQSVERAQPPRGGAFIFQCPVTERDVQGFIADGLIEPNTICVPVECPICTRSHFIDPRTRKVRHPD